MSKPATRRATSAAALFDPVTGIHLEELLQQKLEPIEAIPTPFDSWSRACGDEGGRTGLARGWHVTAAGRSGTGKSVLAVNIGAAALKKRERVGFISLEMSWAQLSTRLMAVVSGKPIKVLEQGPHLDENHHRGAAQQMDSLHDYGGAFFTNRRQLRDLRTVTDAIRELHEVQGCEFFVVDYLQLAAVDPNDPASITAASHAVRQLAQELRVVTVGLSQLNRTTSAANETPTPFGLMGGSAIENDSDQVLLIDHSRMERAPAPLDGWFGYIVLAKNRHGPNVEIPIHFDTATLRLRQLLPDELPSIERGA